MSMIVLFTFDWFILICLFLPLLLGGEYTLCVIDLVSSFYTGLFLGKFRVSTARPLVLLQQTTLQISFFKSKLQLCRSKNFLNSCGQTWGRLWVALVTLRTRNWSLKRKIRKILQSFPLEGPEVAKDKLMTLELGRRTRADTKLFDSYKYANK